LLEKTPGKGGWTYTIITEILPDKKTPFGWVKVKGSIDGFEISKYHLLPLMAKNILLMLWTATVFLTLQGNSLITRLCRLWIGFFTAIIPLTDKARKRHIRYLKAIC
jgi:hypothetical protein